jgi:hypothetical protein
VKECDWPQIITDWPQIIEGWEEIIQGWDEIVLYDWGNVEGFTKIHTLKPKKEKENSTFILGSE